MTHKDAAGLPIDNWGIVKQLSDSALDELMAVCHTEPADGDECVCCAAYMESQEHRRRIATLEADWALVEMWLGATDHKAGAASLATFLNKYRKEATDD